MTCTELSKGTRTFDTILSMWKQIVTAEVPITAELLALYVAVLRDHGHYAPALREVERFFENGGIPSEILVRTHVRSWACAGVALSALVRAADCRVGDGAAPQGHLLHNAAAWTRAVLRADDCRGGESRCSESAERPAAE
jgi:hypothetical protein